MAAVATRSTRHSPHLNARMSSPKDPKRHSTVKAEDAHRKESPLHQSQDNRQESPPRIEAPAVIPKTEDDQAESDKARATIAAPTTTNAQPLAPPPRPAPPNPTDTPDYFSQSHSSSNNNNNNHFQLEPNPFEQSFGNPVAETPGKQLLPPVASLTSPSSLLPGGTPGWSNSLRSGPLSPAMLAGPAGTDYFSESHFRGGFPTPNESSLRTGLTPGGGGSMFPAPSPNTQALFNSLQSGGATPNTLDFHRTALSAAAAAKPPTFTMPTAVPTTTAADHLSLVGIDSKPPQPLQTQASQDPFGQHDTDAANGLYMLANANGSRNNSQFAVPGQPAHAVSSVSASLPNQIPQQHGEISPTAGKRASKKSIGSISGSAQGMSEPGDFSESGHSEQAKPATRSRGKKQSNSKAQSANSRRKADETPTKAPPSKKSKTNNGGSVQPAEMSVEPEDSDEDESPKQQEYHESGRKMTDEEKRKNFLERNRVAALKCRQRKKQWLANLQAKVELFSTENDALSAQVTQLREEIVNLKTLLIAHKDCPVSQAQGLSGMAMQSFAGDIAHHANPYGLALHPNGAQAIGIPVPAPGQPPQTMQRS